MADAGRLYHGLLTGLSRRLFFGEATVTDEYLKTEIYPDMPDESK
jgi:hypothetical protein